MWVKIKGKVGLLCASASLFMHIIAASETCDNTTTYYPSFNGSNLEHGFNIDFITMPNSRTSICIEQPLIDPDGNADSARYACSANGSRLYYQTYNTSACSSLTNEGFIEVPVDVDGTIVDCVCEKSKSKYVRVQHYVNETAYAPNKCTASSVGNDVEVALVLSGTCFSYYEENTPKSMLLTCRANDMAEVLSYSNSLRCDSAMLESNATYMDSQCVNATKDKSWSFSCSGGVATDSENSKNNALNADDVVFLVLSFAYLVFVIILLSVMFCYFSGTICVKNNKVGIEPTEILEMDAKKEPVSDEQVGYGEPEGDNQAEMIAQVEVSAEVNAQVEMTVEPDAPVDEPELTAQEGDVNTQVVEPDAPVDEPELNAQEGDVNTQVAEPDAPVDEPEVTAQEGDVNTQVAEGDAPVDEPEVTDQEGDVNTQVAEADAPNDEPDETAQEGVVEASEEPGVEDEE